MRAIVVGAAALLMANCAQAKAPTFHAVAGEHSITILSSTDTADHCTVSVLFTYLSNGKRSEARHYCQEIDIKPGKDLEVCHTEHSFLLEPRIEGEVSIQKCTSQTTVPVK